MRRSSRTRDVQSLNSVYAEKEVREVKGSNDKARKSGSAKIDKSGRKSRRSNSPRSGGAHGGGGTNGKVPATRSKCVK